MPKYNDFDLDVQITKLNEASIPTFESPRCVTFEASCNSVYICPLPRTEGDCIYDFE